MTKHPVYISGHGAANYGTQVLVPDGQTVHFYAPPQGSMRETDVLSALTGLSQALWSVTGTSASTPATCPNASLAPMESHLSVAEHQVVRDGVELVQAGDSSFPLRNGVLRLCENPSGCLARREHICTGWLGHFRTSPEIHVLSCLVEAHDARLRPEEDGLHEDMSEEYSSADEETSEEEDISVPPTGLAAQQQRHWRQRVLEFLKLSEQDRVRRWALLTDSERAVLLSWSDVNEWFVLHSAKRFQADHGKLGVLRYYEAQPPEVQEVLDTDAQIGYLVEFLSDWLEDWATGRRVAFDAAHDMRALTEADLRTLLDWPRVKDLVKILRWGMETWPDGATPEAARDLVLRHNLHALRRVAPDYDFTCLVGPDDLLLDPPEARTDDFQSALDQQFVHLLTRVTTGWSLRQGVVQLRLADDGEVVLTGPATSYFPDRWNALLALNPHLVLAPPED